MIEKNSNQIEEVSLLTTFTLVVWVMCVIVGVVGLLASPKPPSPPAATQPATMNVEMLNVNMEQPVARIQSTPAAPAAPAPPSPPAPPIPSQVFTAPPALALMEPVEMPVMPVLAPVAPLRPAPARRTSATASTPQGSAGGSSILHLTVGLGLGRAIDPDSFYPDEARDNQETGVVTLRFSVDAAGNVVDVHIITPCRWPLLNGAAIRAVRAARFPTGSPHVYDVNVGWRAPQ